MFRVKGEAGAGAWQPQGPIRCPTPPPATTFQTSSELLQATRNSVSVSLAVAVYHTDIHLGCMKDSTGKFCLDKLFFFPSS